MIDLDIAKALTTVKEKGATWARLDVPIVADRQSAHLKIAGPIILDAVAQRQVLCACRRADRIRLYEAERVQRARQRRRRKQAAGDRKAAQRIQ